MARLHVLAVASSLPAWAKSARDAYLRRMPKGYGDRPRRNVELLERYAADVAELYR